MMDLATLPQEHYSVVLADPPWSYTVYNAASGPVKKGRSGNRGIAERHFPAMKLPELCAMPARGLARRNAALFMWATAPCMEEAFVLIKAWGFKYKTIAFVWVKTDADGEKVTGRLGHYTRSSTEFCLLGVRGRMPRLDTRVEQLIMAPRGRHSAKPPETYTRIERLYDGPYIELFARDARPGWTAWGNEIPEEVTHASTCTPATRALTA